MGEYMNTYAITFLDHTENVVVETPGKAKYSYFKDHELSDLDFTFGYFVTRAKCTLLHRFHTSDLFTLDINGFNRMKEMRGIDFIRLGMRIEVNGKPGIIIGYNDSLNLDVCFDGSLNKCNCHPHWRMKYFDRNLIKEYGD